MAAVSTVRIDRIYGATVQQLEQEAAGRATVAALRRAAALASALSHPDDPCDTGSLIAQRLVSLADREAGL